MKIVAVLLLLASGASAQTHYQFRVKAGTTNVIQIPANTRCDLVEFRNINGIGGTYPGIFFRYPEATNIFLWSYPDPAQPDRTAPLFGPCQVESRGSFSTGMVAITILLTPINTGDVASLVAPAGHGAMVTLETSTNLVTWQTLTNASFPKSDQHRFFRTRLTVEN
jgi:hypothetical protein